MRPLPPAVLQDLGVLTACVFEGVSQHGKTSRIEFPARQNPLVGRGLGELADRGREPRGVEGDGAEGVASNLSQDCAVFEPLCLLVRSEPKSITVPGAFIEPVKRAKTLKRPFSHSFCY